MATAFKNMMSGGGDAAAGGSGGNDFPWWLKYAGKAAGVGAGIGEAANSVELLLHLNPE